MSDAAFTLPDRDRFARHRQISWWNQDLLARAVVIVAGCGALGNEVAKNLALVGVGTLVLVDFDRIERSNLVRSALFTEADIGQMKASVAAEAVRRIYPAARAIAIAGDLACDLGLGLVRHADLVFGCLDSIHARFALNRLALRAGTDWLDGGLGVDALQVALYSPSGGACYECQVTAEMARRFANRYSCAGLARPDQAPGVPTTAVTASVAGALMVEEGLARLHQRPGGLAPGQRLTLQLAPYRLTVDELPADPDCCAHGVIPDPIERAAAPGRVSARDLLGSQPGEVDLGFDLVVGLDCPRCGRTPMAIPRSRLTRAAALCPICGSERAPDWTRRIGDEILLAGRPLGDLGVPDHHIVEVLGSRPRFVELDGAILPEDPAIAPAGRKEGRS